MTVFDADWTDDDVQHALAWQRDAELRCDGCGYPRDETFLPDRANAYDAEPVACHACQTRDRARNAYRERQGDEAGVYWRVTERG